MKTRISHSLPETEQIVADWLDQAIKKASDSSTAHIVGLSGHLGAGKTAFVKILAKKLGITETVTSPTFVIMKIYDTTHTRWKRLIHIDAYRLEKAEDFNIVKLSELRSNPDNLITIEWPENVGLSNELSEKIAFSMDGGTCSMTFED